MASPVLSTESALVELRNVSHSFSLDSGKKIRALKRIQLSIFKNESVVILGPSGSGKSTCIRIIAGLLKPNKGVVLRRGLPLVGPNPDVSLVFQSFGLLPWLNVFHNISIGLSNLHLDRAKTQDKTKEAISLLGLNGFEDAYPRELSGGMKQRVGLARALVMNRPILCLDEPFSSLDLLMAETLRKELMQIWHSQQTSIQSLFLVTHNILEAASMGTHIVIMGKTPGEIDSVLECGIPFPRDERSLLFKQLVDQIHHLVTKTINPYATQWTPPELKNLVTESFPPVLPSEVIGVLEIIHAQEGHGSIVFVAQLLNQDSIQVLLIAKAAELLDLATTPRNEIVLSPFGEVFVASDIQERKRMIHNQLRQLGLFQMIKQRLKLSQHRSLPFDLAAELIQSVLPNDNAENVLRTLIQWGRFGEIFNYNDNERILYLDPQNHFN